MHNIPIARRCRREDGWSSYPLTHLQLGGGFSVRHSVDKNALAILNSNLIPLPNAPSAATSVWRILTCRPDPSDPNRCYDAAVSPSTYWREELFRIDHVLTDKLKVSFRYIHDAWDTSVLTPQWGIVRDTFPTVQNRFFGPGTSLVVDLRTRYRRRC